MLGFASLPIAAAVAGSTRVAFAVFQPVRRRIKLAVDRRFDRARYDGERASTAFANHLRDEVDLRSLAEHLDVTVRAAVAPSNLALWIRDADR